MIPKRYLLVLGTFLLSVLLYVDRICISAARGPVSDSLGLSEKQFGWVLSIFTLGYALCQTPSGWLADRFGPRRLLAAVVTFWSIFTGLTAATFNFLSILVARFIFGAGEAGAFPGIARATYSWIPMAERGIVQGINFSGSRIGAALALPLVSWMIGVLGWRMSFIVLMIVGFAWAIFWYFWFRDDPARHPRISRRELEYIQQNRQKDDPGEERPRPLTAGTLARSRNVWLISAQYFCCNFTFFFCLSWLHPYFRDRYELSSTAAGLYSAIPLLAGAAGNWFSGWLVDRIYRKNRWTLSRRFPAILGYVLAAIGMGGSIYTDRPLELAFWLSIAIFGADMTLAPSWSFCIDIGRKNAGMVSGTMNMVGNLGAFVTALSKPYLKAWTDSDTPYFLLAAGLNVLAIGFWLLADPGRKLEEY